MSYWVVCFLLAVFCKIIFRLEAKGRENIPRAGGFIIASNHTSYLDPVVLAASCGRQLNFMARHDLFTIPLFGAFIRSLGSFPIRRNAVDITSIKEALEYLRQERGLLIFPEGGRSLDELVKKPEPGIGLMAVKSGVPVVPAFIKGALRAFGRNARFIRPFKIKVYFGKPVYPNDIHLRDNYEHFADRIMQEINRLSQE